MAISKVALDTTTGTGKSITALASGSAFTTDPWDVSAGISHEIEISVANASGTPDPNKGSVDVEIFASQDNVNYTSESVFSFSFSPDATSYRYSVAFPGLERSYIKVKITNNMKDSSEVGLTANFSVAIKEVRN